jgi:hypothetical protein
MYNGVYPAYIKPYTQVKPKQVQRKSDEEKTSQQNSSNQDNLQNRNNGQKTVTSNYSLPGYRKYQAQIQRRNYQNNNSSQQSSNINKSNPNAQNINVSQIINDFRSTSNAVGAPDDISKEVNTYLDLIQTQAEKDIPNSKLIQSNLKNASQVLDGYISKTLNTQSNVVENWVDALFMQNIDYKANPNNVNENLKLHLENEEKQAAELKSSKVSSLPVSSANTDSHNSSVSQNTNVAKRNYVPADEKMKNLFVQAKHSVNTDDTKTALTALKTALNYAEQTDDTKMQSMIYYETADLYNKNGQYSQALKGYKIAADMASDENLIAKSYMKSGKIYDDAGLIEPAQNHWLSAIGYAGESDNLPLQVKALNNLADIQGELFNKNSAYTYADMANSLAEETKNDKIKGYSYKRSSQVSEYLSDDSQALQYLKLSTKAYSNVQDNQNIINNYISASDIMLNVGNSKKARTLLDKAFLTAVNADDNESISKIAKKIAQIVA